MDKDAKAQDKGEALVSTKLQTPEASSPAASSGLVRIDMAVSFAATGRINTDVLRISAPRHERVSCLLHA